MPETRKQRLERRIKSALERAKKEQEIKDGILSLLNSMNAAQKVGMSPIGFPFTDAIGLAGDVQMYNENPEMRSAGNYALSGIGLLPFMPSFLGSIKKSKQLKSKKTPGEIAEEKFKKDMEKALEEDPSLDLKFKYWNHLNDKYLEGRSPMLMEQKELDELAKKIAKGMEEMFPSLDPSKLN